MINKLYIKEINKPRFNWFIKIYLSLFGLPLLGKSLRHEHATRLSPESLKEMILLDAGCTIGDFALYLSQISKKVVGLDIVDRMDEARKISKLNNLDIDFVAQDIFSLDYDEYFDGAYALDFFEHIKDHVSLTKKFNKVLKKDGFLIVAVPSIYRKMDKEIEIEVGHVRDGYSKKSLIALLENNGFKVEDIYYADRFDLMFIISSFRNVIIKMVLFPFFFFFSKNRITSEKTGAVLFCRAIKK